jgi:hypothetical protein
MAANRIIVPIIYIQVQSIIKILNYLSLDDINYKFIYGDVEYYLKYSITIYKAQEVNKGKIIK